ncbi:hypothetical protein LOTGIDRAFT_236711 [Lottia gigantea]|uniref:U1 small nuclear ribonucleoprotein 70 kDa n=1 Tax=Lottia gigantea TaxID=225164 RepID=V3YYN4_LOTGI|nr:hypothetical protein LOTGIDRAFT_236711 [Lottia gigantea]ESO83258.1 hypothetical protein LOTGIDRAFT_236711 [Lottia gigantea]
MKMSHFKSLTRVFLTFSGLKNKIQEFGVHSNLLFISAAYKHADGKKIDGRRVLVDVERGRTVKGWTPRRLGGGLGGTRKGGPEENTRFSGREGSYRDDRRSRSRERPPERERDNRRRRSRSREDRRKRNPGRERRRSRSRDRRRSKEREGPEVEEEEPGRKDRKRSRRSRSRDRKRSRSRDRKRSRRSRSRDRRRSRERRIKDEPDDGFDPNVRIKEEKTQDDYRYGRLQNDSNEEAEDRKNFDPALVKHEDGEEDGEENGNDDEGDYEEEEYYNAHPSDVKKEEIPSDDRY